eukprot:6193874-Pleurochrysis_carterae.AAC.2
MRLRRLNDPAFSQRSFEGTGMALARASHCRCLVIVAKARVSFCGYDLDAAMYPIIPENHLPDYWPQHLVELRST